MSKKEPMDIQEKEKAKEAKAFAKQEKKQAKAVAKEEKAQMKEAEKAEKKQAKANKKEKKEETGEAESEVDLPVLDETNEDYDTAWKQAMEVYAQAAEGDKNAAIDALELFEKLFDRDPKNHVIEAYLGSANVLIGRDAAGPVNKFKYTNWGLKHLDHAVLSEPENIEIRSLRGKVCSQLSEMYFHRASTAIEDYRQIVSRYEQNEGSIPEEMYRESLLNLGAAFKSLGYMDDARAYWDKLLSVTGNDPAYKEKIKEIENADDKITWGRAKR